MKRLIFTLFIFCIVLNTFAQHWTVAERYDSLVHLYSVAFKTDTTGVTGGDNLRTIKITNSGHSYTSLQPGVCGTGTKIVSVAYPVQSHNIYEVVDHGDSVSSTLLISTADGIPLLCSEIPMRNASDSAITRINKIYFTSADTGFAIGYGANRNRSIIWGQVLKTDDGGNTWSYLFPDSNQKGAFIDINFINNSTGYALDTIGNVYGTTDSGTTWNSLSPIGAPGALSIFFQNDSTGWVAGASALLFKTTTSGTSWIPKTIPNVFADFSKIVFTDSLHGWINAGNAIYSTDNGGASWPIVSTIPNPIHDICMRSYKLGYAVGDSGWIYSFSCAPVTASAIVHLCPGQADTIAGVVYNTARYDTIKLLSSGGCDSTLYLTVIVYPVDTPPVIVSAGNNALTTLQTYSSYEWVNAADSLLSDTPVVTLPEQDSIRLIVQYANSCIDTSAYFDVFVGIPVVLDNNVTFSPNPVDGTITIEGVEGEINIVIANELGQVITADCILGPRKTIDVSKLSPGVYFLNKARFIKM